ncbi:MAG: OmpH family outer membrane protein [Gammaproteobacteria bacterium]|nr:OmpH family outer membrane protein [Gammaproteobacteria bacterium]
MISRLLKLLCVVLALNVAMAATAQLRVAVVNSSEAAMATEEAKATLAQIEEEFAPESDRLKQLQQDLIGLRDKLINDSAVTSEEERRQMQKQMEDMQFDLEVGAQKLQRELTERRDELLNALNPKFQKALRDLVELENFDIVYQLNPSVLLYVNPRHNITRKVTEAMNNITE